MYFPVGWPKILSVPAPVRDQEVLKVSFDREKLLFAVLTRQSLGIWFNNVSAANIANSLHCQSFINKS